MREKKNPFDILWSLNKIYLSSMCDFCLSYEVKYLLYLFPLVKLINSVTSNERQGSIDIQGTKVITSKSLCKLSHTCAQQMSVAAAVTANGKTSRERSAQCEVLRFGGRVISQSPVVGWRMDVGRKHQGNTDKEV